MHYTKDIIINLPREQVVALMDDPDNLKRWQPTLQSVDHISGEHGKPGAQTRLIYDMNGRTVEMVETILRRDLPHELEMRFQAKNVDNHIINRFEPVTEGQTRWSMDCTFKLTGLMWLMGLFMRGAFTKQTEADMQRFKTFAESHSTT